MLFHVSSWRIIFDIMEKYRRWTDETAGVNPFVAANTEKVSLLQRVISLVVAIVVKGPFFVTLLPISIVLYNIPIDFVRQNVMRLLLLLLGVYDKEDYSLQKADKNGKANIILSNHSCFIDPLYYMYRFPGCTFLGFYQDQNNNKSYFLLSPLKVLLSMFTSLQFFYKQGTGYETIQALIDSSSLKKGGKLVVFYEKIRTIGRGTIKIDKALADDLYNLEKDVLICQMKYTAKKDSLFSLTTSGFSVLLVALGTVTPGNNIKLRAIKLDCKDIHSANQLRDSVNSMAVGALLETKPKSYAQFIEFYQKTQKEGYKLQQ